MTAPTLPVIPADETSETAYVTGINRTGTLASRSFWTDSGTVAHKWGSNTVGTSSGTITYSFQGFNATQQATLNECLALWSSVCNVTFQFMQTGGAFLLELGTDKQADTSDSYSQTGGATKIATTTGSTLSIDPTQNGFELDGSFTTNLGYGLGTAIHEIGHALGLGHTGDYNGSVNSSTDQYTAYDTRLYSVMSYIEPTDTSAKYYSSEPVTGTNWGYAQNPTTMMMLDILGMQEMYGVPTSTNLSGGQIFGFNTNIAASIRNFFDFTVNIDPVITIWDGGTGNTLDLSGYTTNATVDLIPGTFSSVNGLVNDIGIAYNTRIDTAVGGTGNDTFIVNSDGDSISGGGGSDTVVFSGNRSTYTITRSDNVVTVKAGSITNTLTDISTLQFADSSLQTSAIPCYCRGTLILTGRGEVLVETLQPGDLIATLSGSMRPLVWLGRRSLDHRHAEASGLLPPDAWPVRIAAGAFGDGLPHTDLLVSGNHSLYIDGVLIPAFCLVNGATIRAEPVRIVEYFHLELPDHDVLFANGMPAESWLNTGNRQYFDNAPVVTLGRTGSDEFLRNAAGHCVPCVLEGETVLAARRGAHARAVTLGWQHTAHPDLHVTADGARIDPVWEDGDTLCFTLPPGAADIRLASRAIRGTDLAPESNDHRTMGVALAALRLDGAVLDLAELDGSMGWWPLESDGDRRWRWTDGTASLPQGTARVMVRVAQTVIYLTPPCPAAADADLHRASSSA